MSDSRREEDYSAIAWPGFVDILSAVIIMFVFFLMIVATALFFHIIIYKSKVKSAIVSDIVQNESTMEFQQQNAEFVESEEQELKADSENNEFTILFGPDAISVTEDVKLNLRAQLERYNPDNSPDKNYVVTIYSSKAKVGLETVIRKVATARLLNVRNVVLTAGLPSNSIRAKIVNQPPVDGNEHWVRIEVTEVEEE